MLGDAPTRQTMKSLQCVPSNVLARMPNTTSTTSASTPPKPLGTKASRHPCRERPSKTRSAPSNPSEFASFFPASAAAASAQRFCSACQPCVEVCLPSYGRPLLLIYVFLFWSIPLPACLLSAGQGAPQHQVARPASVRQRRRHGRRARGFPEPHLHGFPAHARVGPHIASPAR